MTSDWRHLDRVAPIPASLKEVFDYVDDHARFSSHMSQNSLMMGGGKMKVEVDKDRGQKVGSHIRLSGTACGLPIYLDEVVTKYEPPARKTWETVGKLSLIIIGHYRMGVEISPQGDNCRLKVFIDYQLPESWRTRWLGYLLADFYARWCVVQMIDGVSKHFGKTKLS